MDNLKESFAKFLEQPTREGLRDLLKNNFGELDILDFKADWPQNIKKMAKHLLAFANNGGGVIIIGVKEQDNTLESRGIDTLIDKSDFHNKVKSFIPDKLNYELMDFNYKESEYSVLKGKTFQVILIENTPAYMPFISKNENDFINKNIIYTRRGTKSTIANYEEIQNMINKKIETKYSTDSEIKLEEHLSQLETLYNYIEPKKTIINNSFVKLFSNMAKNSGLVVKDNPLYPNESFEGFVSNMIKLKKNRIKDLLLS